ncbi:hypothetical protein DRQ36_01730 [bacterium]|nr:MAG: hypothetical protein DRQ36_01730 [bacterium]
MRELLTEKEIADEFPMTKKFLYFAGASTGIIPERSLAAQYGFLQRYRKTDLFHDPETFAMMSRLRSNLAKSTGAAEGEIALVPNTSTGLNIIAAGFPWQPDDEILVGTREFPANTYPWQNLKNRGVNTRWIEMHGGRITPEMVEKEITASTRLLAISAVQFSDGYRLDLKSIVQICHRRGIAVIVDGIQAAGALKIGASETGFDAFVAGGQKHLLSPYGSGFLQVTRNLLERLRPAYDAWLSHFVSPEDFIDLLRHNLPPAPDARRLEIGSLAYGSLWGMDESIKMILELGIANIENYNLGIANMFCEEIARVPGAEIVSDRSGKAASHIVSVKLPDARKIRDKLTARKVVVSLREGCLRFAFHIYNSPRQIERAISIIKQLID